jgi:hypothetical protein
LGTVVDWSTSTPFNAAETSSRYTPQFFNSETIDAFWRPSFTDAHSPGARAARVNEYDCLTHKLVDGIVFLLVRGQTLSDQLYVLQGVFMSENPCQDGLSRRKALKLIAGSVGVAITGPILKNQAACQVIHNHALEHAALSSPRAPKYFNSEQMQIIDGLSETIIPEDAHSPGARAARVNEYIDEIVSGSSNEEKAFWAHGLAAIDKMAELEQGKKFKDCNDEQHRYLVAKISEHEDRPSTLEERFFVAVKKSTVDGYYTSEIGIHQELEYQGNAYLLEFPGCKHKGNQS